VPVESVFRVIWLIQRNALGDVAGELCPALRTGEIIQPMFDRLSLRVKAGSVLGTSILPTFHRRAKSARPHDEHSP